MTGLGVVWGRGGGGDLVVIDEGRGSLADVEGLSGLSRVPFILSHSDLSVIHGVVITGGRGLFHDGRAEMFSISIYSEPCAKHSSCLTNVFFS